MYLRALIAFLFLIEGAIISTGNVSNAKNHNHLTIGIDGRHPPFSHQNLDGEFFGFEIDLAKLLCKKMKAECTFVQFDWSNLIAAVRGEKINMAIAAIRIDTARSNLVEFSDPYLQMPSGVVVRKDSILSGLEAEDLRGAQLGVLKSSLHAEYIRTHLPQTHRKFYEAEKDFFVDLINKQLDGVAADPVLLDKWLQTSDGKTCCRMLGTFIHDAKINGEGFGIAIAKLISVLQPKNSRKAKKRKKRKVKIEDDLLANVNEALEKIRASGEYKKLLRLHLPYLK